MPESTRRPIARRAGAVAAAALALLLAAWLAPGALAQAAEEAPTEPRFPIERITVEGARHASAELIVAESLLTGGRSYSEDELRQAVYRIKRLPFVIDTRFALRRGSERGRYELVITVEEASPVFFGLDLDNGFAYFDPGGFVWSGRGKGTVGARWFAGEHGVVFGAVEGDEGQIGYTHYNLFGRRVFASFVYGRTWSDHDGLLFEWDTDRVRGGSPEPRELGDAERFSLLTGFPLTVHQSVRFSASSTGAEPEPTPTGLDPRFLDLPDSQLERARAADVQWIYDSTDDPVLPTRGRLMNLGLVARNEVSRTLTSSSDDPFGLSGFELVAAREELENLSLIAGIRRYRPLSSRQVLWESAQVALGRTELEQRFADLGTERDESGTGFLLEYGGGWAVRLWEPGRRRGDLRFETTWRLRHSEDGLDGFGEDGFAADVGIGFVLRNRWGLFRFGLNVEELSGGG